MVNISSTRYWLPVGVLLFFFSFGKAQKWEPFLPYDQSAVVPAPFHSDTVRTRVLDEYPGTKYGLYMEFAQDISGIATWNIIKGEVHPELKDWDDFLKGQIKRLVTEHGDTTTYHLQILRDPSINAYATAGGYVFIHIGLLAEARNLEEVVLVLGHELGHNFSQHAWEGYLDRHRASNTIMITSFMGGMAGLIGRTAAISSYMNHSREDESEADEIAINLLESAKIDLQKGAGIYRTFIAQQENQQVRFGNSSRHWFYGSTHPAPTERYARLITHQQADHAPLTHGNFLEMRKLARLERLALLLAVNDYRTAIESAWRYLIQEPNDQHYEQMMFDALRRLNLTRSIPKDAMVLQHGYNVSKDLEHEVMSDESLSSSSKNYLKSILMIDTLIVNDQPFPLNITFEELGVELQACLKQHDDPESELLLALNEQAPSKAALASYLKNGGRRSAYANWLINRTDKQEPLKTLLLPTELSIPGNEMVSGKDYTEFMEYYDWDPILQRFRRDGYQLEIIRKDKPIDETPYSWEMLERLERFNLDQGVEKKIDPAILDPDLGEFMMDRNIGGFASLSLGPAGKFIRCDLRVSSFPGGQVEPQLKSDGMCIGIANDRAYLSNQVLKRYRKLKP